MIMKIRTTTASPGPRLAWLIGLGLISAGASAQPSQPAPAGADGKKNEGRIVETARKVRDEVGRSVRRIDSLVENFLEKRALGATGPAANARLGMLEEVLVTAQKRVERLSEVPISANVISADRIAESGITDAGELSNYVPGFTHTQTGLTTIIAIRGISSGINQAFEQSVGVYVDGIYHGRAQLSRAPYMDVERVEVLRGPQPALFGKNSIAGAVNVITARPGPETVGDIQLSYTPEFAEQNLQAVIGGSFGDSFGGRLAILNRSSDGHYSNTTLDRDEPEDKEQAFRASIVWQPNESLSAFLKWETGSFDNTGRFLEIVNPVRSRAAAASAPISYAAILARLQREPPLETTHDFRRQSNGDASVNNTDGLALQIDYDFGSLTLTALTGISNYDTRETCDCDFTHVTLFNATGEEDFEQFSQELRVTSQLGGSLEYIAGLFYQDYDLQLRDSINIPADSVLPEAIVPGIPDLAPLIPAIIPLFRGSATARQFSQDSELLSAFAQVTWDFSERWSLTLGGRYTQEDKTGQRTHLHVTNAGATTTTDASLNEFYGAFGIEPNAERGSLSESNFAPALSVKWQLSDNRMLYASYASGFKAGGFDARSNASPDPDHGIPGLIGAFQFKEEEATSVELGAKLGLADGQA